MGENDLEYRSDACMIVAIDNSSGGDDIEMVGGMRGRTERSGTTRRIRIRESE